MADRLFGHNTGRRVTVSLMVIHRVADGQIGAAWSNRDDLGLLRQLGAL